jgi:hypothetical protein
MAREPMVEFLKRDAEDNIMKIQKHRARFSDSRIQTILNFWQWSKADRHTTCIQHDNKILTIVEHILPRFGLCSCNPSLFRDLISE